MAATVELRTPFDGRTFTVTGSEHDGSVMAAIRDGGGLYEPDVMRALARLARPDAVCLDVGANVGAVTLVLSHLCPEGRVHAFEAAGENVRYLDGNLAANGVTNAVAHHLALYDTNETLTLHFTSSFAAGSFVSDVVDEGVAERVPARRLDDWVAEAGLDRVDLVKLDVEGAEAKALAGGTETIRRHRPHLVVEFNPIVAQRFQRRPPRALWDVLSGLYPHRFAIGQGGSLTRVLAWPHLRALLHERAVVDLVCSFDDVGGGGRVAAAADWAARRVRAGSGPFLPQPRAEVVAGVDRLRLRPGEVVGVQAWVRNTGDARFPGGDAEYPVHLGCRWFDADGRVAAEGQRVDLGGLRPGQATRVAVPLEAPARPGRYRAALSPIQDRIAWFDDLDPASAAVVVIDVEP